MIWRDRYRNVESTHFQEEMMARGLAIEHLEVDPVPEVADTVELGKFDPPLWLATYGRIV